jgi:hypothetical protein
MWTDGQAEKKDMTKLTVAFRNFAEALTKKILLHLDLYSQLLCLSELTLWWQVVNVVAPETNRDLRQLRERFYEEVMGGTAPERRYCIFSLILDNL